jgi:hypothetical protein
MAQSEYVAEFVHRLSSRTSNEQHLILCLFVCPWVESRSGKYRCAKSSRCFTEDEIEFGYKEVNIRDA